MTHTAAREASAIRAGLGHPIIDADGHFVEIGPLLDDEIVAYVEESGGARLRDAFLRGGVAPTDTTQNLSDRDDPSVRAQWRAMPSWWGWPTHDARDRATGHLPALLYERLDELGIDYTILYPSMSLAFFEETDEELSSALCRAVNRYHVRQFAPYRDRCTVGALVPMNTPEQAVDELRYAVRVLGAKSVLIAGHVRRPLDGGGYRLDTWNKSPDCHRARTFFRARDSGLSPGNDSA